MTFVMLRSRAQKYFYPYIIYERKMSRLVQKYNVPGPRYTSYPTVPYWEPDHFDRESWIRSVQRTFGQDPGQGLGIYIHLPYCESLCTFCGCHKRITKRHEVEAPYIAQLLQEWKLYSEILGRRPLIQELHLGGGTPTFFSPDNLKRLMGGILELADRADGADFSFEGHPNNTTREHLQALFGMGFNRVSYGVQDYNPAVQQAIHRIQPFENVRRVTDWSREIGYGSVGHDLIYGLPFQGQGDIALNMARTQQLRPDRIAFYSYAHVPWIKGNGQRGFKESDLPDSQEKGLMFELGKKLLQEAGYRDVGMDHFALEDDGLFQALENGSLHRNFMGYTTSTTKLLLGLGISSISDSWGGFAQNVKQEREYGELLSQGVLPVAKGHILDGEDLIIRRQILDIMCQFSTQWGAEEAALVDFHGILKNLEEMREDGLVELGEREIRVTPLGRPFVRNICMAFDLKLHRNKPETRIFSMTV